MYRLLTLYWLTDSFTDLLGAAAARKALKAKKKKKRERPGSDEEETVVVRSAFDTGGTSGTAAR